MRQFFTNFESLLSLYKRGKVTPEDLENALIVIMFPFSRFEFQRLVKLINSRHPDASEANRAFAQAIWQAHEGGRCALSTGRPADTSILTPSQFKCVDDLLKKHGLPSLPLVCWFRDKSRVEIKSGLSAHFGLEVVL